MLVSAAIMDACNPESFNASAYWYTQELTMLFWHHPHRNNYERERINKFSLFVGLRKLKRKEIP